MVDTLLVVAVTPTDWIKLLSYFRFGADPSRFEEVETKLRELDVIGRTTRKIGKSVIEPKSVHRQRQNNHSNYNNFVQHLYPDADITISGQASTLVPYLEKHGLTWAVADQVPADMSTPIVKEYLHSIFDSYQPRTIGISTSFIAEKVDLQGIVNCTKQWSTEIPIIIGGSRVRVLYPEKFLYEPFGLDIDVVCYGDGEETYPNIVKALLERRSLDSVPGIIYKQGDSYYYSNMKDTTVDLNKTIIPRPRYLSTKTRIVYVESVRGCRHRCAFCSYPYLSRHYRVKSAERLYREFQDAYRESFEGILCLDSTFSSPVPRLKTLCKLLANSHTDIGWYCFARVEDIGFDTACLMRKAGCRGAYIGIETIDERTLRKIGKPAKLADIKRTIGYLRDNDILVYASFIVGLPGDSSDTYHEILNFVRETNIDIVSCNPLRVEPETLFYRQPESFGLVLTRKDEFTNPYWSHESMDLYDAICITYEFYYQLIRGEIAATHDHSILFDLLPVPRTMPTGDVRSLLRLGSKIQKILWQAKLVAANNEETYLEIHSLLDTPLVKKYFNLKKVTRVNDQDPGLVLKAKIPYQYQEEK